MTARCRAVDRANGFKFYYSLGGDIDQSDLNPVEREATPRLSMKLSIQLYLTGIYLSDTVSVIEIFGVKRARLTVHNWVHETYLQPEGGHLPDHVAVDETVIRLNDEQYLLYAAVDPETSKLLHTKLRPTTTKVPAHSFLTEISEKHDVDCAVCLVDGSRSLQAACHRHGFDFRYEKHGNRNAVERVFRDVNRRTICFSNCFSNAEAETASFAWSQLI